jgi:hypothetical protein
MIGKDIEEENKICIEPFVLSVDMQGRIAKRI